MTKKILKEIDENHTENFKWGEHLYLGMAIVNGHRACISVAYKMDYCVKKALQFMEADPAVVFTHINKFKIGATEPCDRFNLDEE
ncbi:hypothetical protein [Bergeyella cardium]|uniref:Uncharacterized protein n=1 Tax=Bergeyella cardium TaxID=1585976 RepID=A0A6P1QXV7_9FLAO|nr:hypothetical protein [Bergeyella cardium]QHN65564.1 hypothetical protein DBX24_06550 [Bergeyella cardium]WHE33149.1 hypothetical protein P8603_06590 [Bergeyella cardium]WHF59799.1 hypothetical protein O0R51_06590 [Bergeyella cardium]